MKKTRIIAAAAAAVTALVLGSCTNYEKLMKEAPADYIAESFENSIKTISKKDSFGIKDQVSDALEKGSVEFAVYDGDITYLLTLDNNKNDMEHSAELKFTSDGSSDFSLMAGRDNENLYFSTSGESGKNSYYIDIDNFESDFENSIFHYSSDSWYSFSRSECEYITEAVNKLSENGDNKTKKEFMKLFNKLEHTFSTDKVQIGSDDVKADIITFELDEDEISELLDDIADILSDISDDISDLEYAAKSISETSSKLTLNFYINSKTHNLMMAEGKLKSNMDGSTVNVTAEIFFGKDPSKTEEYYIKTKLSDEYSKISAELTLSDSESTKNNVVWNAALKIDDDGDKTNINGSLEYNKKSGDYEASLRMPIDGDNSKISVSGKITSDKSSAQITAEKISASFADDKIDMSASVKFLNKIQNTLDKSSRENLLEISEDEFDALGESIGDDIIQACSGGSSSSNSPMGNYIRESKLSSVNANAKLYHTAAAVLLTEAGINNEPLSGSEISGSDHTFYFGNTVKDGIDYLGENAKGYFYGEYNPNYYSVQYIIWSEDPIPDNLKKQLSYDEQNELAKQGTYIGCYPLQY